MRGSGFQFFVNVNGSFFVAGVTTTFGVQDRSSNVERSNTLDAR